MRQLQLPNIFVLATMSLAIVYSLVACQANQRSGVGISASNVTSHGSATTSGPIDSGGENLINGVPLESYAVDVTSLNEFKLIKPILHSLSLAYGHDFVDFAKMRNWYFIPVSLADLSNQSVGVDLKIGTTQTVALQGRDEIWIDNNLYQKQSAEEKSKILLHEIVRTLNSLKYQSIKDICKDWLRAGNNCEKHQLLYNELKSMQPLPSPDSGDSGTLIRKNDTEGIRDMTMWLLGSKGNLQADEIFKRFSAFNFDRRYFDQGERLIWPSKHIKTLTEDEFNFLIDQVLDSNNLLKMARRSEQGIVSEALVVDTGSDSNDLGSGCSLNFVDQTEISKAYNIIPNKESAGYSSLKACLRDPTYEGYNLHDEDGQSRYDLRWVYGRSGPMILFSVDIADEIYIRRDPTENEDSRLARFKAEHLLHRRGYFIFALTGDEAFSAKNLRLRGIKLQLTTSRHGWVPPSNERSPSQDFGYVEDGVQDGKVLLCAPSDERAYTTTDLSQFRDDVETVHEGNYEEYFTKYYPSDSFFTPTCEFKNLSEIANKDSLPQLFASLKNNSHELDGLNMQSDPFGKKQDEIVDGYIFNLNECEHPTWVTQAKLTDFCTGQHIDPAVRK